MVSACRKGQEREMIAWEWQIVWWRHANRVWVGQVQGTGRRQCCGELPQAVATLGNWRISDALHPHWQALQSRNQIFQHTALDLHSLSPYASSRFLSSSIRGCQKQSISQIS